MAKLISVRNKPCLAASIAVGCLEGIDVAGIRVKIQGAACRVHHNNGKQFLDGISKRSDSCMGASSCN